MIRTYLRPYEVFDRRFHNKAINDYQIKSDWSQEALTEAKLINSDIKKDVSFLDYPFVTIDGEDAKILTMLFIVSLLMKALI